jgi:serine protease Do
MTTTRLIRIAPAVALAAAASLAGTRAADPAPEAWDPTRTTSPGTVAELKALQARVREVAGRVVPSTVGLLVGPGVGSGVIVGEDGLVLTCAHVIGKPGRSIRVVLADGTPVVGKTLGQNTKIDSGMVRITGPLPAGAKWPGAEDGKWPAASLGKGTELKKGQWVVSLGHPGGPKPERPPPLRVGRFENYSKSDHSLRSDCTLVGGDSGGPLFDLNGRLVGIHSRIGLFLEYNMHIPTELFRAEWEQLLAGESVGKASRAESGLALDDAKPPAVKRVEPGGPAERAGVKAGDVLAEFDGEAVASAADVTLILHGLDPGQGVALVVHRGPDTVRLKLTLGRAAPPPKPEKDR